MFFCSLLQAATRLYNAPTQSATQPHSAGFLRAQRRTFSVRPGHLVHGTGHAAQAVGPIPGVGDGGATRVEFGVEASCSSR